MFNCTTQSTNTITLYHNTFGYRSVSLLSSCYPEDYRTCNYSNACYIRSLEFPSKTWIGVYLDEDSSVSDSQDRIYINNGGISSEKTIEYSLNSVKPGLFYHRFQDLDARQVLSFRFTILRRYQLPVNSDVQKFKLDLKSML